MAVSSSTYRDAPLLLNLERKEDGSYDLASTWCNLGLWPQSTFSEACRALARRLGAAPKTRVPRIVSQQGPLSDVLGCWVRWEGDQDGICEFARRILKW